MTVRTLLFVTLSVLGLVFLVAWLRALPGPGGPGRRPSPFEIAIGFLTNFFDTLGIGSFAPTTAIFKLKAVVPDDEIPGTLLVGHTPPVIVQAFIFIAIVTVDPVTLAVLILGSVLGAWLGAGVVTRWPRRRIQIGMGIALLLAAGSFLMAIFGLFPVGGAALGLAPPVLAGAAGVTFILGALMTLGIGFYAPCMVMVSLLGMNPVTAFPIMMGASAFLMPVAGLRFLSARRYGQPAALGLAVGGLPAVLIAAFLVKSLPLTALRWLVVVVVLYAAVDMLRSARLEGRSPAEAAGPVSLAPSAEEGSSA